MSTSDNIRERVKREYDEEASWLVDTLANNTGKGIVSFVDNDELEGDVKLGIKLVKRNLKKNLVRM